MTDFRPLRVLIVEDEGLIAMDIEGTVEDAGHVVAGWATSAREAIEIYDSFNPDVVFLDIQLLHGSSGVDVAIERQRRTGARWLFMTGNGRLIGNDLHGGIGVLEKPFSNSKLVAVLDYFQQGLFSPPPSLELPRGLTLSPDFSEAWA